MRTINIRVLGKYALGAVVVILVMGGIYKFVVYPAEVRKECSKFALNYAQDKKSSSYVEADAEYEFAYRYCFQQRGLEPNN